MPKARLSMWVPRREFLLFTLWEGSSLQSPHGWRESEDVLEETFTSEAVTTGNALGGTTFAFLPHKSGKEEPSVAGMWR